MSDEKALTSNLVTKLRELHKFWHETDELKDAADQLERAARIMRRAVSWLQIKEAAFATAKGPAIIEEMQSFIAGSPDETKNSPPHWTCSTHGDFDAMRAVGCPECMREARQALIQIQRELWGSNWEAAKAAHKIACNALDGAMTTAFAKAPLDCKHEHAAIKCPDCGIDLVGTLTQETSPPHPGPSIEKAFARSPRKITATVLPSICGKPMPDGKGAGQCINVPGHEGPCDDMPL